MSTKAFGSDASRQSSRVNALAPSSDNRLNHDGASTTSSQGKKRDHDALAMEDLLKPSIIVKPHPSKLSIKPRSLQPLMLLPREHLPLSFLDLATPSGDFEYAQYYESTIKILDLESRMGNRPVVLIARMETNKTVYVLERQDGGLYTLCRLGNWVDLSKFGSHATVAYSKLLRPPTVSTGAMQESSTTTPQLHKENKKRRLAMEAIQSLVKRPARSRSVSTLNLTADVSQVSDAATSAAVIAEPPTHTAKAPAASEDPSGVGAENATPGPEKMSVPDDNTPARTANDIFENVRHQYFEALYHSMGSLAYFAKGPLSRARAAFHLDCDSNLDMNELVDFLKSLILTTIQIDKKYRDSVPGIIAKMKTHIADSGDEQGAKSKKRQSKKTKLGKDALYPNEDDHIRRWWNARKPQLRDDDDTTTEKPQETKLQISRLRSRETQLQMIIILEILALEPLRSAGADGSQLPGFPKDDATSDAAQEASTKKRNKHNFPVLLDVQADRLSIWQSTSLDEIKIMDDAQSGGLDVTQKSGGSHSDPLKDFCVEIIVPFFSSRLPEQCDSLNRKLGGPVMPSPPKPKPKKAEPVTKPKTKPGALTKRPTTTKTGRTLDRVLSKESELNRRSMSRGPSSMIALMRSATTPIPILKREPSDAVSMNLPSQDSKDGNHPHDRSSSALSGFVKRTTQEEKAKKEAEIKAELQAAISSLRKPNREVVGKAMAEADERKASTSLSQLKKARKPTEHPGTHSIVKATPAGPRFRNALARDAHSQPAMVHVHESIEADYVPSSSAQRIPASVSKKRKSEIAFMAEESSLPMSPCKASSELIDATPVRQSFKRNLLSGSASDEGLVIGSSPIATRKYLAVPRNSLTHRDSGIGMPSSPGAGVAETPIKKPRLVARGSLEGFVTVTPAKNRAVDDVVATPEQPKLLLEKEPARRMSIYEKLGWDDDYDELL